MSKDLEILAQRARQKALAAISLVDASLAKYHPYNTTKKYTPDELEPYDALANRYIRAVEICIKLFRTEERLQFGEASETYRDLLNRMEKLNAISSTGQWIEMRDLRNRIVHDYLPEQIEQLFDLITQHHAPELLAVSQWIKRGGQEVKQPTRLDSFRL